MPTKKSASKPKKKTGNQKSAAPKVAMKKFPTVKEPLSKSNLIKALIDFTGISKKEVVLVLESFTQLIEKHLKTGGPGTFIMPGICKMMVVKKPARPAREGINPFTKEKVTFKAKPAYKAVKIRPLKKLKAMVV